MSNIYFDDANEEDDGRPRFYLQRAAGWMPLPRTLDAVLSEWDRDAIASMLCPAEGLNCTLKFDHMRTNWIKSDYGPVDVLERPGGCLAVG